MKNEVNVIWIDLNEELFKFIIGRIKDDQISKDIHQEVFLKIQNKIHQLKDTSKLTLWVYQITRNEIIDYFRKVNSKKSIPIDDLDIAENESDNFEYTKLSSCIIKR